MKLKEIENIIKAEVEGSDGSYPKNVAPAAKEIYKLHLEDKINLLKSVVEHPTKPGYRRLDVLDILRELQQELKSLEE